MDVTRAILMALADVHPQGLGVNDLAERVNCEQDALRGQLRLLTHTGAVRAGEEVRITEPAIQMLKNPKRR